MFDILLKVPFELKVVILSYIILGLNQYIKGNYVRSESQKNTKERTFQKNKV